MSTKVKVRFFTVRLKKKSEKKDNVLGLKGCYLKGYYLYGI